MLAFVHIHKTAGTTLNWILRSSFGVHHWDVETPDRSSEFFSKENYGQIARFSPRIDSIAGHKIRSFSDLDQVRPDIRYYTFVRDPVARIASLYQHGVQRGGLKQSPEEWLEDRYNGQTIRIAGVDDADAAIEILEEKFFFVGDVKHFEESLLIFQAVAENPQIKISLQARNVAPSDREKKLLLNNPRIVEMIRSRTRNDQIVYDYVNQNLYPRYRQAYGPTLDADLEVLRSQPKNTINQKKLLSNFAMRRLIYRPLLKVSRLRYRS